MSKTYLNLYKVMVNSKMWYGCEIWGVDVLPKGVKRLSAPKMVKYETLHLRFLKKAMGVPV